MVNRIFPILIAAVLAFPSAASATERVHVIPGFDGAVNSITAPAADGTRYVGGGFTAFNAIGARGAAVVSPETGEVDRRFPQVVSSDWYLNDAVVKVAVPDGSGGWYIGGDFEAVDDTRVINAAHIRGDGSLDFSWRPDPDGEVLAIAVSGSTVYIGGRFKKAGGATRKGIAAIGTDGKLAAWNPKLDGAVAAIAVVGPTVYFAGGFSKVGIALRRSAAAVGVDGTLKPWNPGPAAVTNGGRVWSPGVVYSLAVSGSTVYMGGFFDHVGGHVRKNLAAVGTDGVLQSWDPRPNLGVNAIQVEGSDVYVGGLFTQIAGKPRLGAAMIGHDGKLSDWTPALSDCGYESTCAITSIALRDGVIYLAGAYGSAAGKLRKGIAAFGKDGSLLDWYPNPRGGENSSLIAASDSGLYLAGDFTSIGGESRTGLAALDADGRLLPWNPDLPMKIPTGLGASGVTSLALAGSAIYFATQSGFKGSDGEDRGGVAAISTDGTLLPWHPDVGGVSSLAVVGSTVYIGGEFSDVNGHIRSHAAAVGVDGTLLPWNPRVSDDPNSGTVSNGVTHIKAAGSTVYLAGDFVKVGGKPRLGFAAVNADGTVSDWNPQAKGWWIERDKQWTIRGFSNLTVSGSTVYLLGDFGQVLGKARDGLAAVSTDGKLLDWNPTFEGGEPVSFQVSDSVAYVGGYFTKVNGQARSGLASFGQDGTLTSRTPSVRRFPEYPSVTSGSAPSADSSAIEDGVGVIVSPGDGVFLSCGQGVINGKSCDGFFSVGPEGSLENWGVARAGDVAPNLTAPTAPIIGGGPPSKTASTSASFSISASPEDRVTCAIDGGILYLCGSVKSYTGLKPGPHIFCVRVVNATGVQNVATRSWQVTKPKRAP